MPRYTLTIDADNVEQLQAILGIIAAASPNGPGLNTSPVTGEGPPAEPPPSFPNDQDPPKKKGRPKKESAPSETPAENPTRAALEASVEAEKQTDDLPPLDTLKAAVTSAVRAAQKGEGDRVILQLLPAFKEKTGLDFVMNATDVHRRALLEFINSAGVTLG
jgi:hypothetical protein